LKIAVQTTEKGL